MFQFQTCTKYNLDFHFPGIFSLKYHPTEEHLLVTAGWDNTVQVWDLRKGSAVFFSNEIIVYVSCLTKCLF